MRWIYFSTGASDNGSSYVPARFISTGTNTEAYISSLSSTYIPSRVGYTFDGWYLGYSLDSEGEIVQNSSGQMVVDNTGAVQTFSSASGFISDTYGGNPALRVDSSYDDRTNPLRLYAKWTPSTTQYYIYYWVEGANSEGYSLDDFSIVTGAIAGSTAAANGSTAITSTNKHGTISTTVANLYSGSHITLDTAGHPINQPTVKGDGSTVVNVYYNRDKYTLRFYFARSYEDGGHTFFQVNTNDEGFQNNANTSIEEALTRVSTNDYQLLSGTNTWKEANVSSAAEILSSAYLTAADITFNESVHFTTINNVTTWVIGTNGTAGSSTTKTMKYYFIEKTVKYGQNLSVIWPTPGASTIQTNSTTRNNPAGHQEKTLTPILFHKYKGGTTEYFMMTEVDNALIADNVNGTVYFLQYFRGGWDTNTKYFTYRSYIEALSGETPDVTYGGKEYVLYETKDIATGRTAGEISVIAYPGVTLAYIDRPASSATSGTFTAYYNRNRNTVIFMPQVVSGETITGATDTSGSSIVVSDIAYGEGLTLAAIQSAAATYTLNTTMKQGSATGRHYFIGWYDNPAGTGDPIDFSTTSLKMADDTMTFYAKWREVTFRVDIDPAGGEIDHINHAGYTTYPYAAGGYAGGETITAFRPGSGYNKTHSTYFFGSYGATVGEYGDLQREFVPDDDIPSGVDTYYYIYTDFRSGWDGEWGLQADLRNAIYVKQSEVDSYFAFFKAWSDYYADSSKVAPDYLQPKRDGVSYPTTASEFLSRFAVKNTSGQIQTYRRVTGTESYQLLGWYLVDPASDETTSELYNFNTPITGPIKIRAKWRFYGSYQLKYNEKFTADNGDHVNANVAPAYDPDPSSTTSKYADNTLTTIREKPTAITVTDSSDHTVTDKTYVFVGWYIADENGVPLEGMDGAGYPVVFYQPGQTYTVNSFYARVDNAPGASSSDKNTIYMQAYYEEVTVTARRPYITNLKLDANGGTVLGTDGQLVAWTTSGVAAVTKTDESSQPVEWIRFGDVQSSTDVHLYRYATDESYDGEQGTNYFSYTPGHFFLLGFDPESDPESIVEVDKFTGVATGTARPYNPNYPANSVIAVTRNDDVTLYAVWEPMVYLAIVNDTDNPVTVDLGSSDSGALYILNKMTGNYERNRVDGTTITVTENSTTRLVMPHGYGVRYRAEVFGHDGYEMTVTNVPIDPTTANKASGTIYDSASDSFSGTLAYSTDYNDLGAVITVTEEPMVSFDLNVSSSATVWQDGANTWVGTYVSGKIYRQVTANKLYTQTIDQSGAKKAARPANPQYDSTLDRADGAEFMGWTADAAAKDTTYNVVSLSGVTFFNFNTAITAPTTLYAVWKRNEVTFDINGGNRSWNPKANSAAGSNTFTHSATELDQWTTPVEDPTDYEPADPSRSDGKMFVGWVSEDALGKLVAAAVAAGDTNRDTLSEALANTDWSSTNNDNGYTIEGTNYVNYLAYLKANMWNFSNQPPYGQTLYALWSDTVTVTFDLVRTNTSYHHWNGSYDGFTRAALFGGYYRYYWIDVAKGDYVPMPESPAAGSTATGWNTASFLYWTESNQYCNSYSATPTSVTEFAFGDPLNISGNTLTLYTSWTSAPYTTLTIQKNLTDVPGLGDPDEVFDFTYVVHTYRLRSRTNNSAGTLDSTFADPRDTYVLDLNGQSGSNTHDVKLYYWTGSGTAGGDTYYYLYFQTVTIEENVDTDRFSLSVTGALTANNTEYNPFNGVTMTYVSTYYRNWRYGSDDKYLRIDSNVWYSVSNLSNNYYLTAAPVGDNSVTFTNTRKYENVTIAKELNDPIASGATFSFTATLRDNGKDITLPAAMSDFQLGHGGTKVFSLPVGSELTVTETANVLYDTAAAETTSPTVIADFSNLPTNVAAMTVPDAASEVTFTNTRKSVPVEIRKVDDSGNPLSGATFTLTGDPMIVIQALSSSSAKVFEGRLYHGATYTLTETAAPSGYTGLDAAITITVADDGTIIVTSNPKLALTGNVTDGYVITVTNEREALVAPTGFAEDVSSFPAVLVLAALLAVLLVIMKRRMDRRYDPDTPRPGNGLDA